MKYHHRIIDELLQLYLQTFKSVLLMGPKGCGKMTTATQFSNSSIALQQPLLQSTYKRIAELNPYLLLEGENPRAISEWQTAPVIWDAVRHSSDHRVGTGLYILTGSMAVDNSKIMHSGIGRIARLKMYTLSLYESNDSTGNVSLKNLFENSKSIESPQLSLKLEDYARFIIRGGWPHMSDTAKNNNQSHDPALYNQIITTQLIAFDGISRDGVKVLEFLRSCARFSALAESKTKIRSDIKKYGTSIHMNTIHSYLQAAKDLFIVENLPAWIPPLKTNTTVRRSDLLYFTDPAIPSYLLNLTSRDLLFRPNTFENLFKTMVIRDLRVYSQAMEGRLFHYHDRNGLSIDTILQLRDGRWAAIVIELGITNIEQAKYKLLKFRDIVDTSRLGEPIFLMIVTTTQFMFQLEEGIWIVPLGCLGP